MPFASQYSHKPIEKLNIAKIQALNSLPQTTITYLRLQFNATNFNITEWKKKYHQNQIEYLRVCFRCIKLFAGGLEPKAISDSLSIDKNRVVRIIQGYIDSSYEGLLRRITRKQPTLLSTDQEQAFKTTILTSHPSEHGLNAK